MLYEILPDTICPGPTLARIKGRALIEVLAQMTLAEVRCVLPDLLPVLVDPSAEGIERGRVKWCSSS